MLIVDDDDQRRDVMSAYLVTRGFDISAAHSGLEALLQITQERGTRDPYGSRLSPGTMVVFGNRWNTTGDVLIFDERLPLPRISHSSFSSFSST